MKVLIAIPTMATMPIQFFTSFLGLEKIEGTKVAIESGSLVYMARSNLTAKALDGNFDYIFWLDSDMTFEPNVLKRLVHDAEYYGLDCVTGICFKRSFPTYPTILKELSWDDGANIAEPYKDYPKDELFDIAGCGLACCLVKVDALKAVMDKYQCSPFEPLPGLGEDYSFCYRLAGCGIRMMCDSRVKFGHVGSFIFNESVYNGQTVTEE